MLDVASLGQFDFFQNFHLYSGQKGTYRIISNVVILDHEVFENDYSDFHEGDFVITNLLYAKEHPDLISSSLKNLMHIGVSAIAIKSIFFEELPADIIEISEELCVPIYFFNHIYIEDVILNIVNYLRSTSNYSYYEQLIDAMYHTDENKNNIKLFLDECKKTESHYITGVYLSNKQAIDAVSVQRNLNQMQHKKNSLIHSENLLCIHYNKGILILYFSLNEEEIIKFVNNWRPVIADLGILQKDYYIGILDQVAPASHLDLVIKRCFYANQYAIKSKADYMNYSQMHLQNLFIPASENRYIYSYLKDLHDAIVVEDGNGSNLLIETLTACVSQQFNIENAAKDLFLHPNTIRYRLNKMKLILGCQNDFEFQIITTMLVGVINNL